MRFFKPRVIQPHTVRDGVVQAVRGLAHLHGQTPQIIHRDVKPSNILLHHDGQTWQVQVADFDHCKEVAAGAGAMSVTTGLGGTQGWTAPEMLDQRQR